MINIAIVEDEWQCAEELQQQLLTYSEEYGVEFNITRFSRGEEFLFKYRNSFDIVFMDVDMPEMNGFVTAKKLRGIDADVVLMFITYLAKYACKGYEVDALDYIVKPVKYTTLRLKIDKAISKAKKRVQQEVLLSTKTGLLRLPLTELLYIEINGHNIEYHTVQGTFEYYGTLKSVESKLPENQFCRCNNNYLVNLRCVSRIEGDYVIIGAERLAMSRPRKAKFIEALHKFIMGM